MTLDIPLKEEIFLRLATDDVRRSFFIEDLPGDLLAIEQTDAALENSRIGSVVLVTYCPFGQTSGRSGFDARIESLTDDDRVILRQLSELRTCDLRVFPRIRLDRLPSVRAFCHDREIQVIDLSGGGTHLVLREDDCASPPAGATVPLKFVFETGETTTQGEILRQWTDPAGKRHMAVKFTGGHTIEKFIY